MRQVRLAELIGVPVECGVGAIVHVNSRLPGPGYPLLITDLHGESELRQMADYLCRVGAESVSIVCE